jgi:hypothetical protein
MYEPTTSKQQSNRQSMGPSVTGRQSRSSHKAGLSRKVSPYMDRGGTTPLFLHASSTPSVHALAIGTPLTRYVCTGKADLTCTTGTGRAQRSPAPADKNDRGIHGEE